MMSDIECLASGQDYTQPIIVTTLLAFTVNIVGLKFLTNQFEESYTPTLEDFHRKLYRIRGDVYQLDILDPSGNHPFPATRRLAFLTGGINF
ncbi:hypothetical protein HAZT_HAZT001495 [Hyalella azteca]|uniref:Uncharacterized protein n=1 Tax=Hyalella azteca TaxID=294128 RepID=A0A6A0GUS0_HYAAZ|nr:hypothetical protein HAZT_HAZT001495 [Hyalella azteca]